MQKEMMEKYEALPADMQRQVELTIDRLFERANQRKHRTPEDAAACFKRIREILDAPGATAIPENLTRQEIRNMRLEERYADYL